MSFETKIILIAIFLYPVLHTYFLYPFYLLILKLIYKKGVKKDYAYKPSVSIIISAYNEERLIKDCVQSLLDLDYPKDKIEIIVGSDGSNDKTSEIVSSLAKMDNRVILIDYPRSGKNKVLNNTVPKARNELICFMDADCRLMSNGLSELTANFADASVGAAICRMDSIGEDTENSGGKGEKLYQEYEIFLRSSESEIYSTVNSLGAFYAIRKEYYKPLPNTQVCDDYMPILDTMVAGKRVIFDKDAIVNEVREKSLDDEFGRRVRVSAGGLATVKEAAVLLNPLAQPVSFFLWSHKVLRWFSPVFLLLVLATTFSLDFDNPSTKYILYPQLFLYLLALLGWFAEKIKINSLFLKVPLFFVSMNIGFLLAIFKFLTKKHEALWSRDNQQKKLRNEQS